MGPSLSVRQKIALTLWLITFLLLTLVGTLVSVWFSQDQANRLDEFLTREVRGVKDTLETYFTVNGNSPASVESVTTAEFQLFLKGFLASRLNHPIPYKTTLGIFSPSETPIGASNSALDLKSRSPTASPELQLETVQGPREYRLASISVLTGNLVLATVRMACLTVTLGQVWQSFLFSLLLVLVPTFRCFGTLGTLLLRWSLRPVREMSLSAASISESHLDHRLVVPRGNDEISAMARTLNTLLDRLEKDYEFEEALVGQLSHELRTPLAILRGRNEVALSRFEDSNEAVQAILEDNIADVDQMVSLLNTLLNLARLESRLNTVKLETCDLSTLLKELIEELEPLWVEKELMFRLELEERPIRWEDCPPIPESSLDLVFKRFYRVEVQDPDHYERESGLGQRGFGLGLSIVKTLVEHHTGDAFARSTLSKAAPRSRSAFRVTTIPFRSPTLKGDHHEKDSCSCRACAAGRMPDLRAESPHDRGNDPEGGTRRGAGARRTGAAGRQLHHGRQYGLLPEGLKPGQHSGLPPAFRQPGPDPVVEGLAR